MHFKILNELILFSIIVAMVVVVFATGKTVGKRQDEMVNQEAYFYGMSHLLKSSEKEEAIASETDQLASQAFFWGVRLN